MATMIKTAAIFFPWALYGWLSFPIFVDFVTKWSFANNLLQWQRWLRCRLQSMLSCRKGTARSHRRKSLAFMLRRAERSLFAQDVKWFRFNFSRWNPTACHLFIFKFLCTYRSDSSDKHKDGFTIYFSPFFQPPSFFREGSAEKNVIFRIF